MHPRSLLAPTLLCASLLLPSPAHAQQIEQAVEDLTTQIVDRLQAQGTTKIAVLELTDLSGSSIPLGQLIAEELVSQLFLQGESRFQLVERSKLEEVLGEQQLGVRGLLEKQNIEAFGRVLGVEAILTGTIAVLEDRVRINARLIGVPSAELFATASAYMGRLGLPEHYFEAESTSTSTNQPGSTGGARPVATKEANNVSHELLRCAQATRLITCEIILTNNGADAEYRIIIGSDHTSIFDQRGHQFPATRIRIADVEASKYDLEKFLITEVPTRMTLFFEGVPSAIEFIKILYLQLPGNDIEFRDIHFSE